MKTSDPRFKKGISDISWFKKGHKLSSEAIEKMRKAKTKYTPEELKQREKDRNLQPDRIQWRENYYKSPKRRYTIYERSAKIKHIVFSLSFDDFLSLWGKPCIYCGSPIETIGIDRVENTIGYELPNIVTCCKICNYMKRELSKKDFLLQCHKIVSRTKNS